MRADTKKRKKATQMLRATQEQEWWADQVVQVMLQGKRALDTAMLGIGRLVAETIMYMEREEKSGPDYHPTSPELMESADEHAGMAAILLTLAKIHNEEGRASQAQAHARRCLELAREHQVAFVIEEAEQILTGDSARR